VAELSDYELMALREIEDYKARLASHQAMSIVPESWRSWANDRGEQAAQKIRTVPGFNKAAQMARSGYMAAASGLGKGLGNVTKLTLSEGRLVGAYRKKGFDVSTLSDIRKLDLQDVEKSVRPRYMDVLYASGAAAEGMGAGVFISGGELVVTVGSIADAGATAAPGIGFVATTLAVDAAAVMAICTRAVGHVAMYYGYDPNDPAEAVFMLSVLNLGSAVTASGKYAAYAELSRLTQSLARGATWTTLERSALPVVLQRFARVFGVRLTKRKLGQMVPIVGIAVGGGVNYLLVDSVTTSAYWVYRERFLNEKRGIFEMSMPPKAGPDVPGNDVEDAPIDVIEIVETVASEQAGKDAP
jgi:hypothetical protein